MANDAAALTNCAQTWWAYSGCSRRRRSRFHTLRTWGWRRKSSRTRRRRADQQRTCGVPGAAGGLRCKGRHSGDLPGGLLGRSRPAPGLLELHPWRRVRRRSHVLLRSDSSWRHTLDRPEVPLRVAKWSAQSQRDENLLVKSLRSTARKVHGGRCRPQSAPIIMLSPEAAGLPCDLLIYALNCGMRRIPLLRRKVGWVWGWWVGCLTVWCGLQ